MRRNGGLILALGALLGLAISIYNYVMPVGFLSPLSSINGTLGALVPIASTIIILIIGMLLASSARNTWPIVSLAAVGLIGILGTGFAGLLLDSTPLLLTMVIAATGWLMWVFGSRLKPIPLGTFR